MSHSSIVPKARCGRTHGIAVVMAVAVCSLAACAPQTGPAPAPDRRIQAAPPIAEQSTTAQPLVKGRQLADMYCAACHAIGASGASPAPEAPPFRRLSALYSLDALEEALAEGILVGHPMMPEFTFTPDQIDALIAYLKSVQEKSQG